MRCRPTATDWKEVTVHVCQLLRGSQLHVSADIGWSHNALRQCWNRVFRSRVNDFGRVGSGHGSVWQTWCLTLFL